ncbi:MAG TPA: hypothetical protein VE133_17030 [Candidatus Sulfotelmatobacter sp.]|nr:hypothetical protein [Candidatus Sulfotelmatobacter sp.]
MATNKIKRSIHMAQPHPQHTKTARAGNPGPMRRRTNPQPATGLMPVRAYVYRAIAELNAGFELTLQELKRLQQVDFFPSARLAAMYELISDTRAQVNHEFFDILGKREAANTVHRQYKTRETA